jgi:lipid-A-disaccharide synthase
LNKLLIVAGEASADPYGASVVKELSKLLRQLESRERSLKVWGVGGDSLMAEGAELIATSKELGVVGLTEMFAKWSVISKAFRAIVKRAKREKPDVALLLDYPGFNIRLAKVLKKMGIPVVYYISPQIWAWRPGRIKTLKECVAEMLVVFPFEEAIYRKANVPVKFVGHPLLESVNKSNKKLEGFDLKLPIITLMPGSRVAEIRRLMPPIMDAAKIIHKARPDVQFGIPLAPTIDKSIIESYLQDSHFKVNIVENNKRELLNNSAAAIVCSGTATLDVGLASVPMVIIYKVSAFTEFVGRWVIKPQLFGMANIILGKRVVPELFQREVTGKNLASVILQYLTNEKHSAEIRRELSQIKGILGEDCASYNVAERLVTYLNR